MACLIATKSILRRDSEKHVIVIAQLEARVKQKGPEIRTFLLKHGQSCVLALFQRRRRALQFRMKTLQHL